MVRKTKAEKHREHIERTAQALYQKRELMGILGNAQSDWETAEKIASSPLRTRLFAINRSLIKLRHLTSKTSRIIAWDIPKWFLFSLPNLEWVKLLAVPLTVAAAGSIITGQIQREANQNAALEKYFNQLEKLTFEQKLLSEKPQDGAIVLARGRTVAALRELDLSRKTQLIAFLQASGLSSSDKPEIEPVISFRGQNLSGLDLRSSDLGQVDFRGSNLRKANLKGADLGLANLKEAYFKSANLKEAYFKSANLKGAYLELANLEGVDLYSANLEGADLYSTNLKGAYLKLASLKGANLGGANLKGAYLELADLEGTALNSADLEGAALYSANLAGADLWEANLAGAGLWGANVKGAAGLTQEQLTLAKLCRTILPDDIDLDPNRDCGERDLTKTMERIYVR